MRNTTKILIVLIFATLSQNSFSKDKASSVEDFMQSYLAGYEHYLSAGDAANVESVTTHFTQPLIMISPSGPNSFASHQAFAPNIKFFLDEVLKKKGVAKLDWEKLQIVMLSDTQALVSGLANAIDRNGKTIEQRASVYLLNKLKNNWRVAVNLPHPPANTPNINE